MCYRNSFPHPAWRSRGAVHRLGHEALQARRAGAIRGPIRCDDQGQAHTPRQGQRPFSNAVETGCSFGATASRPPNFSNACTCKSFHPLFTVPVPCTCLCCSGHGAAVGPLVKRSIWTGGPGIIGRGHTFFDTLVFSGRGPIGSEPQPFISWHRDNEPLFGKRGDPKV